ncbi:nucleotide exchange factor GrpE [Alkalibacterium iburiense]|uniref:Protein GrpE n=1 Tax=Alkalibacterium iburiense TaxID=290589 RepID=A0ABN0XQ39_9LACT
MVHNNDQELKEEVEETTEETEHSTDSVDDSTQTTEEDVVFEDVEVADDTSSKVEELQKELDEMSDRYLRLQAEMANMRRRNQREKEDIIRFRSQSLAKELLPALDNIERALSIEVDTEAGKNLKKGIEMVYDSLLQGFSKEGIEVIDPLGEPFDPNYHEAYTQVPANEDQESNEVAQVFEKGYKLHNRVLRAAKVSVTL